MIRTEDTCVVNFWNGTVNVFKGEGLRERAVAYAKKAGSEDVRFYEADSDDKYGFYRFNFNTNKFEWTPGRGNSYNDIHFRTKKIGW